jgi:hypothetical protein
MTCGYPPVEFEDGLRELWVASGELPKQRRCIRSCVHRQSDEFRDAVDLHDVACERDVVEVVRDAPTGWETPLCSTLGRACRIQPVATAVDPAD